MAKLFDKVSQSFLDAIRGVVSEAKLDPVNPEELKGTHAQRKDKDINNDGKVDKTDEYLHNRRKAIKHAMKKKMKEEVEELDELSSDKMTSYLRATSRTAKSPADSEKRKRGAAMAVRRLEKEEVQIDELSKKTLGSYVNKAATDVHNKAYNAGKHEGSTGGYDTKKLVKSITRQVGINKAVKKLANEEVQEAREPNKPYVKPHSGGAWKASNKWGKVKYFGKDFKKSAEKHAGISENLIDEISTKRALDYMDRASDARGHKNMSTAKQDKRYKSMALAHEKIRARRAKVPTTEEMDFETEGYVPTNDMPTDKDRNTAAKVAELLKRERDAKKMKKEEVEQIDELSPERLAKYKKQAEKQSGSLMKTMRKHFNKADRVGIGGAANTEKSQKHTELGRAAYSKALKRTAGAAMASSKLTKEEQEFIDALNNDMFEEVDIAEANLKVGDHTATSEKSRFHDKGYRPHLKNPQGKTSYLAGVAYKTPEHAAGEAAAYHKGYTSGPGKASERGADDAVRAYRSKNKAHMHSEEKRKEDTENLDEARGRPKKAGQMDYTVHPKTKEKLMHNNPAHMKRIENLYRIGTLERPKREAGQNVITQLRKASTSMRGGETINFTHGTAKHVSGTHAAKLLDKHASMKPAEKEAFQKEIGHSHEKLKKHL
jgi:hypothetical protein